uniref:Large ribosomal subunit protein bL28 n=1 Tax=Magnetococcus massalia (strain MO-1) TaxID=451514 RepID=A0A1S7LKQ1_MAGMO|nr:50S ribosomal protein L28 [Candidatus Magnetococcus massalia]
MARKNTLGKKGPQSGFKVSHSHRKTKRKWMPNIQTKSLYSMALESFVRVTISVHSLRTVDRMGGLDNYLLQSNSEELTPSMRKVQRRIRDRVATKAAA